MNYPLVTVVIPSFNHEEFVEQAIRSVLEQDYPAIELIVIDDGSTDLSRSVISGLNAVNHFIYIEQENIGIAKTLNKAIYIAKGEYIAFLASDDYYYSDKISTLMLGLKSFSEGTAMIFGDADLVDRNGKSISRSYQGRNAKSFIDLYYKGGRQELKEKQYIKYAEMLKGNFVPAMSTLCDVQKLKQLGMFSENYKIEDYPMWLSMLKKYNIGYVDRPVAAYRQHGENSIIKQRQIFILEQIKIVIAQSSYALKNNLTLVLAIRLARLVLGYLKGKLQ